MALYALLAAPSRPHQGTAVFHVWLCGEDAAICVREAVGQTRHLRFATACGARRRARARRERLVGAETRGCWSPLWLCGGVGAARGLR